MARVSATTSDVCAWVLVVAEDIALEIVAALLLDVDRGVLAPQAEVIDPITNSEIGKVEFGPGFFVVGFVPWRPDFISFHLPMSANMDLSISIPARSMFHLQTWR